MSDKYKHMEETWGIEHNPYPAEAINSGSEPYNPEVFPEESDQFYSRLVYGAAMDQRGFSFLWSKGKNNEDTGMGKTTMLRQAAKAINADSGDTVLRVAGMRDNLISRHRSVAAYVSFNTTSVTGVYSSLFGEVEYLANPRNGSEGQSLLEILRTQIMEDRKLDEGDIDGLRTAIREERRKLGATLPPLRDDVIEAFCAGGDGDFAEFLTNVSPASRVRNGLAYFDFAFTVIAAAGIRHLFMFVDQLEDLATTQTVTKAKRTREVGRLRDIISETEPFIGHVHFIFTFHVRAATALDEMWRLNRLPSYDPEDVANQSAVVVLRGIHDIDQVRTLLTTYSDDVRIDPEEIGKLAAFDESALPVLLDHSCGRPGILLADANKLINNAAELELPTIDGEFAAEVLGLQGSSRTIAFRRLGSAEGRDARAIDDLLR